MKGSFDEHEIVASFNECTGLMPSLTIDEEENEDVARLYAVHSAETEEEKCANGAERKR